MSKEERSALYRYIRYELKEDFSRFNPLEAAFWLTEELGKPVTPTDVVKILDRWRKQLWVLAKQWNKQGKDLEDPNVWKQFIDNARDKLNIYLLLKRVEPIGG